jgi:DNA-binding MarR family transcriptional regulator
MAITKRATGADPSAEFELRRFLPSRLTILSNRLTRHAARVYSDRFKLSAPEWRTLAVLGQQDAMSATAVMSQSSMDKVRVSRAIAKLLKAELITRETDPGDRRRAILNLTMAGQEIYRQIIPLVQDAEAEMMATLSEAERKVLEQALSQIEESLRS